MPMVFSLKFIKKSQPIVSLLPFDFMTIDSIILPFDVSSNFQLINSHPMIIVMLFLVIASITSV